MPACCKASIRSRRRFRCCSKRWRWPTTTPGGAHLRPQVLSGIATAYAATGDLAKTIHFGERAITSAQPREDTTIELGILPAHGDALLASGQPDRAAQVWQRYLTLSSNIAILDGIAPEMGMPASEAVDEVRRKFADLRVDPA